jgi:hypothetical protein
VAEVSRESRALEHPRAKLFDDDAATHGSPLLGSARELEEHIDTFQANDKTDKEAQNIAADVLLKEIERNVVRFRFLFIAF